MSECKYYINSIEDDLDNLVHDMDQRERGLQHLQKNRMSASESKNCEWENLPLVSCSYPSNLQFINENELIVCANTWSGDGIYKFSVSGHKWTKIMKYPKDVPIEAYSMAHDKINNVVYLATSSKLHRIDLSIKTMSNAETEPIDDGSRLLHIGNTLHYIRKGLNGNHCAWNTEGNKLKDETEHEIDPVIPSFVLS